MLNFLEELVFQKSHPYFESVSRETLLENDLMFHVEHPDRDSLFRTQLEGSKCQVLAAIQE